MKKILMWTLVLLVSISLVGVFSLTSCKEPEVIVETVIETVTETVEVEVQAEEEVSFQGRVLTLASSQSWVKDVDRELAEEFGKETGIIIDFQITPDPQYIDIMNTKLNTGEAPDIFLWAAGTGLRQIEDNLFDLSDEPWVPRLEKWAYDSVLSDDGKVLGLQIWSIDGWGMLYNTEIFDEYGLTPPKDYAEFLEICETLKTNGIIPIWEFPSELWHTPMLVSNTVHVVANNNPGTYDKMNSGELKLADIPELVLAVAQIKALADKGYFGEDYMSHLWTDSIEAIGTGKYAMILAYTTFQMEVAAAYPDSGAENFKMFPSLEGFTEEGDVNSVNIGAGVVHAVNKDSENIDLVRAWFEFRTKPENLEEFYEGRDDLSVSSFTGVEMETLESMRTMSEYVDGNMVIPAGDLMFWDRMVLGKYIEEMLVGTLTPLQVLENFDVDRGKLMELAE